MALFSVGINSNKVRKRKTSYPSIVCLPIPTEYRSFEYRRAILSDVTKCTLCPSSDNPLKPETPVGPTSGAIGHSYEYLTKAVDPNDDQIMYIWDWNGDMIPDEWTGFYDSNTIITTSHIWTKQDNYIIRVKARDTDGLESVWSDPLSITMPRNKLIHNPILKFLQNHPYLFPILQLILQ